MVNGKYGVDVVGIQHAKGASKEKKEMITEMVQVTNENGRR
jgi:hypothetical protein